MPADIDLVSAALANKPLAEEIPNVPDVDENGEDDNDIPDADRDEDTGEDDGDQDNPPPATDQAATAAQGAGETDRITPEIRAQLAEAEALNSLLSQNPAEVARLLLERMTPEQRAAITGQSPAQAAFDEKYQLDTTEDELTVPERIAWENRHMPQKMDLLANNAAGEFRKVGQEFYNQATIRDYEISLINEKMDALAELLDIKFPDADSNTIGKHVTGGKAVKDAVKEIYGKMVKDVVSLKKAQAKPSPRTPAGRSDGDTGVLSKNAGLREIAKFARENGEEAVKREFQRTLTKR